MKKLFLVFIATACAVGMSNAQEWDSREKITFGPKVGVNISNVYDSEGEDFTADSKVGLAAGAFVTIPLGTYLGIHPEILFSQKGFQASGSILGSGYKFKRTTNYIDLPIFVAVKPTNFLTVVVGPQYSFLVSQKDEFDSALWSTAMEQEFDNDNIRRNMLALVGGVDFNISRFVIGARAGLDMTRNHGDGTSSTPRYKNFWLQGTVGFSIF
jgi:hypothetical protein